MKTIKLAFALIIAALAMTACVEDKVYEGPNTIEAVSINPVSIKIAPIIKSVQNIILSYLVYN